VQALVTRINDRLTGLDSQDPLTREIVAQIDTALNTFMDNEDASTRAFI